MQRQEGVGQEEGMIRQWGWMTKAIVILDTPPWLLSSSPLTIQTSWPIPWQEIWMRGKAPTPGISRHLWHHYSSSRALRQSILLLQVPASTARCSAVRLGQLLPLHSTPWTLHPTRDLLPSNWLQLSLITMAVVASLELWADPEKGSTYLWGVEAELGPVVLRRCLTRPLLWWVCSLPCYPAT